MLILDRVSLTFGKNTPLERTLFQDLSLTIYTGEFVSVIGDNGSGKSSLLNLIAGVVAPHKGRVLIEGHDTRCLSTRKRAALIAHVAQDPRRGTLENLTIEENMSFAQQRGRPRPLWPSLTRACRERFRDKLSVLSMGLEDRLSDSVATLSGGQRQALSLIMATLQPAKLLLLDEITAALDRTTAATILEVTERLVREEKMTTLMITHNPQEVGILGGRTLRVREGGVEDIAELSSGLSWRG